MNDWTAYCEHLEQYFTANDVEDLDADKKRAILLSYCEAPTYRLIRNLVAPAKPTTKSFADFTKLVADHYIPSPSMIVQCFQFNSHSQKDGESIAEFVADLCQISEHCNYKFAMTCSGIGWCVVFEMLVSNIVYWLNQISPLRKQWNWHMQTAEMAAKNSKQLQNTPSSLVNGSVHAVNSKQRQQK